MRYYRTVVNLDFWFQYKPALPTEDLENSNCDPKLTFCDSEPFPSDCTVIIATVGPDNNAVFEDMVSGFLFNQPVRLIFSATSENAAKKIEEVLLQIKIALAHENSTYQKAKNLGVMVATKLDILNADISNKRPQDVHAFKALPVAPTSITVLADDTAIWPPRFLKGALPAFADAKVGFVGTKKWLKCQECTCAPRKTWLTNTWMNYLAGFWNTIGALYLIRHNFEIQATNAADGGIFCVSARTCIIIVPDFQKIFLTEFIFRLGSYYRGIGPLVADDDNFLTRHTINNGWDIKVQCTDDTTITTPLGVYLKLVSQCLRWSCTTSRQNPLTLFVNRTIWWKWPVTVWTTYFPWMLNFVLIWDPVMVYLLVNTELYAGSAHRGMLLGALVAWIYMSKLVKTVPWFWEHTADFWMYFFPLPMVPLFMYAHSLLKFWTLLTFWDLSWAGRKLP
jgi:hypothetical protein